MTDHPITPPPDLVEMWVNLFESRSDKDVFSLAAQWGADQELEACCKALESWNPRIPPNLRAARRPKSPSLKEQALLAIDTAVADDRLSADVANVVRRALEQLDD